MARHQAFGIRRNTAKACLPENRYFRPNQAQDPD